MLIGINYRKLETSYTWFENTFLDSFQQPKKQELFFNHLSPWNAHLVNLTVDPDSQHAGKTIRQAGIRESYQLLIVGIERAGQRIINPDTDTVLMSLDKLWLVGERANIENLINKGC